MQVLAQIAEVRAQIKAWRQAGETIGFVPTMGSLHAGHMALVARARELATKVVVSVFVNPTQFDRAEDLAAYPRTLAQDCEQLAVHHCDLVFTPSPATMYPQGALTTKVDVLGISSLLEGASRPGHFTGVATVVCKLFNIVQPDVAVFGEKDFQQLMLIKQMVRDLDMDIQIVGLPTVREVAGLAMSSRNGYLTTEERQRAPAFNQILRELAADLQQGNTDYPALQTKAMQALSATGFKPDYIEIRRAYDLQTPTLNDKDIVILGSAWLGKARLIDNIPLALKNAQET